MVPSTTEYLSNLRTTTAFDSVLPALLVVRPLYWPVAHAYGSFTNKSMIALHATFHPLHWLLPVRRSLCVGCPTRDPSKGTGTLTVYTHALRHVDSYRPIRLSYIHGDIQTS